MRFLPSAWFRFAGMLLLWAASVHAAEPLRTAGRESPPLFDYESSGKVVGLCSDLFFALEHEDRTLRFTGLDQRLSFPMLWSQFFAGQLDVLCAVGRWPEQESIAIDLGVVAVGHKVLTVRRDDPVQVADLAHLAQLSQAHPLLVRKGTSWVKRLRDEGVQVLDDSTENVLMARMVAHGRARWFYTFDYVAERAIRDAGLEDRLRVHSVDLGAEPLYLLVSNRVPVEVRERLAKAWAQIKQRGEYGRLLQHHGLKTKS